MSLLGASIFSRINSAILSAVIFECYYYIYTVFIVRIFDYYGFSQNDEGFISHVSALLVYVVSILALKKRFNSPSDFFLLYMNLTILLPTLVMHSVSAVSNTLVLLVGVAYCMIMLIVSLRAFTPRMVLNPISIKFKFVTPLLLFLALVLIAFFVYVKGFNLNFNLKEIYSYRQTSQGSFTGLSAYLVKWLSFSVFPFIFLWGLYNKQYALLIVALVGQFIVFGYTNHKSYFFNIVLILAVYVFFKFTDVMKFRFHLSLILICFLIFTLFVYAMTLFEFNMPASLFFRRMMFWPVLISDSYVSFAQEYGALLYGNQISTAHIISDYMGRDGEYVNSNFISNAFLQLGWLAVFFSSILVGGILLVYDRMLINRIPLVVLTCFCLITFKPLFASDMLVALLSNGVAFMMALQVVLFNKKIHNEKY